MQTTTLILYGPQAIGKTRHAEKLAAALSFSLHDDWNGRDPLRPGTLAITNTKYTLPEGGVAFHVEDEAGIDALVSLLQPARPSAGGSETTRHAEPATQFSLEHSISGWVFAQRSPFSIAQCAAETLPGIAMTRDIATRIGIALRKLNCVRVAKPREEGGQETLYVPPQITDRFFCNAPCDEHGTTQPFQAPPLQNEAPDPMTQGFGHLPRFQFPDEALLRGDSYPAVQPAPQQSIE